MCDKCFSVYRTWSIFLQCFNMRCRTISFIGGKSVFRKNLIIFFHHPVSGHFGNNTCCRNGYTFCITFDDGYLRNLDFRYGNRIVQKQLRLYREPAHCLTHCLIGCLQDIDLINSLWTCHSDSNRNCSLQDHIVQFFSLLSCKLFRIIQP